MNIKISYEFQKKLIILLPETQAERHQLKAIISDCEKGEIEISAQHDFDGFYEGHGIELKPKP